MYKRGPSRVQVVVTHSAAFGYQVQVTNSSGIATPSLWNIITPVVEASGVGMIMPMTFGATIADVNGYTELTQLYDQYKITGVSLKFVPLVNMSFAAGFAGTSSAPAIAPLPSLQWALDFDDLNWTGVQQLEQKARLKEVRFTKPTGIYWRPTVEKVVAEGAGAGTSAAAVSRAGFFDCGHTDIRHYGLKACLRNMPDPAVHGNYSFEIRPMYYLTMKEVQ